MRLSIPILWRYLIGHFLKVLFFSLLSFIVILLTIRLEEIAQFASLAPKPATLLLFILNQIPYILPIATPISCLISAYLLMNTMSATGELTSLRGAGYSLTTLFIPLYSLTLILSFANFYITSELATHSHLATNLFKEELRSINPLLLLDHKRLIQLKGMYFNTLGPSKTGEFAEDVIFAMPQKEGKGMYVILAKRMEANHPFFTIYQFSLMTTDQTSRMFIENIKEMQLDVSDFSKILEPKTSSLNDDHLTLTPLLARLKEKKDKAPIYSEILRRLSIAFATFTFTFMGIAFGISTKRTSSHFGLLVVSFFCALTIITYFLAKGQNQHLNLSASLYFLPHLFIIAASLIKMRRIS